MFSGLSYGRGRSALLASVFAVSGCDPGVHVGWKDTFQRHIDRNCIRTAVESVAGKTSVSEDDSGGTDFPGGLKVYHIWYEQPDNEKDPALSTGYRIDIFPMKDGSTGYIHQWGKLGTSIPIAERNYVIPVMAKVNTAVAQRCGIIVGNSNPVQGDG